MGEDVTGTAHSNGDGDGDGDGESHSDGDSDGNIDDKCHHCIQRLLTWSCISTSSGDITTIRPSILRAGS